MLITAIQRKSYLCLDCGNLRIPLQCRVSKHLRGEALEITARVLRVESPHSRTTNKVKTLK